MQVNEQLQGHASREDRGSNDSTAGRGPLRIAVLASGNGTNLQAIIDAIAGGSLTGVELAAVLSDKPGCHALERATAARIATRVFPASEYEGAVGTARERRDAAMTAHLKANNVNLVVLAGYMQILSATLIDAFDGRIINVHPALLPRFPGLNAIEQALEAGASETGVTVHFVDHGVDTGPVIAQERVAIEAGDTPDTLAERIHAVEHRLLPAVIGKIAARPGGSG